MRVLAGVVPVEPEIRERHARAFGDRKRRIDLLIIGISHNKPHHPAQTIDFFRAELPIRPLSMTHQRGYDYVLLVPMHIDNVTEPYVDREFAEDIDHDADYAEMIESICKAYTARWHMR